MKKIALLLAGLLLLSICACTRGQTPSGSNGHSNTTAETTDGIRPVVPNVPSRDPSDTDTPSSVDTSTESGETGGQVTQTPETTKPVEVPFLQVKSDRTTVALSSYYTWDGEIGSAAGAEKALPQVASILPTVAYSESFAFFPKEGGTVCRIRAFDTAFSEVLLSDEENPLASLEAGVYYIAVAVKYESEGREFLFRLAVDTRMFFSDPYETVFPAEQKLGSTVYDAEKDAWTVLTADFSPKEFVAANNVPTVTYSDDLRHHTLFPVESISFLICDENLNPLDISGDGFDTLTSKPPIGTSYVIITVEWRGDYIEAHNQYETETYAYVAKLIAS